MLKLSLYDFDKTIYHSDTGVKVFLHWLKKYPFRATLYVPYLVYSLFRYVLKFDTVHQSKENVNRFLNYFTKDEWDLFIQEFWKKEHKNFFSDVVKQIEKDKENHYTIGIISASPEIMLYPVMEYLPTDFLIGTSLRTKGEFLSSVIIGKNCKNHEKVERLHQYIKANYPNQEYCVEKMYSDSLHDLPLLELAKEAYTIEKNGTIRSGFPTPNKNI